MENLEKIYVKLHPLERKVINVLDRAKTLNEAMQKAQLSEVEAMRALQWLSNKNILSLKEDAKEIVMLDENGRLYLEEGMPEKRFLNAIKGTATLDKIKKQAKLDMNEVSVCLGQLRKKGAIEIKKDKDTAMISILPQGKNLINKESLEEQFLKTLTTPRDINTLTPEERYGYEELKKRKGIIKTVLVKERQIELTPLGKELIKNFKMGSEEVIERLTHQIMRSEEWKKKKFRAYDVEINVPKIDGGKRHFVNQTIEYVKKIWLEMGFEEMHGNIVQTSFWDLDALFVPQDHPARAMQDTFYLATPDYGKLPALAKIIKNVHENGWTTGSKGWQEPWDEEKAEELLLRTHTTVLSAQTLAKIKENKTNLPKKYFSIGKVFRNEAIDWKHLFEFYQVEGIVVDKNANFRHLLAYLKEFFRKMGYKDARIRPAHFPYTEPSCEIEVLHPEKNEWIELGGAGIFRPEVTKPLIGQEVPVLAWGFGLERIICPYYKINDLRELYSNNLKQLREIKIWRK